MSECNCPYMKTFVRIFSFSQISFFPRNPLIQILNCFNTVCSNIIIPGKQMYGHCMKHLGISYVTDSD